MYVKTFVQFVMFAGGLIAANVLFGESLPAPFSNIIYIAIGVDFLYLVISPRIRYERYRYRLTAEELEVQRGLVVIRTEIVPIERLHKIEVTSGPIFRAFHLKELLATTAGGDIHISYLTDETADEIAGHLKKRINTIAVEERNVQKETVLNPKMAEALDVLDERVVEEQDGER